MHLKFNSEFCERVSLLACLYIYIHIYIIIHLYIQSGLYVTLPQGGAAFSAWWPPWPSWAGVRPMSKTWIVQSISFLFCIYCRTKYVQKYNIFVTKLLSRYYSPYFVIFTVHKPVGAVKPEERNWWWQNSSIFNSHHILPQSFLIQLQRDFQRVAIPWTNISQIWIQTFLKILFTSCLDQGPPLKKVLLHLLRLFISFIISWILLDLFKFAFLPWCWFACPVHLLVCTFCSSHDII